LVAPTGQRLDDGEVSPSLSAELHAGDTLELRGPIGGYFVWDVANGGPLFLVGGGSGIVPLMAMLRHRNAVLANADADVRSRLPVRLLYASSRWESAMIRDDNARRAQG